MFLKSVTKDKLQKDLSSVHDLLILQRIIDKKEEERLIKVIKKAMKQM